MHSLCVVLAYSLVLGAQAVWLTKVVFIILLCRRVCPAVPLELLKEVSGQSAYFFGLLTLPADLSLKVFVVLLFKLGLFEERLLLQFSLFRPFKQLICCLLQHDVLTLDILQPRVDFGYIDPFLSWFFTRDW